MFLLMVYIDNLIQIDLGWRRFLMDVAFVIIFWE